MRPRHSSDSDTINAFEFSETAKIKVERKQKAAQAAAFFLFTKELGLLKTFSNE
jgi:hypothetical protein